MESHRVTITLWLFSFLNYLPEREIVTIDIMLKTFIRVVLRISRMALLMRKACLLISKVALPGSKTPLWTGRVRLLGGKALL